MAGVRSKSRELALQIRFQKEFFEELTDQEGLDYFQETFGIDPEVKAFAHRLLEILTTHQVEIDAKLRSLSSNWTLERMSKLDLNILRLAAGELFYTPDTPPKVVLNEAIELAKKYGNTESAGFINGVLDALLKQQPQ